MTDFVSDDDFSIPLSTIEFPRGQTSVHLSIELVDDDICDDMEEMFTLRLESSDFNVLVGDIGNTTVTINDDDGMERSCDLVHDSHMT